MLIDITYKSFFLTTINYIIKFILQKQQLLMIGCIIFCTPVDALRASSCGTPFFCGTSSTPSSSLQVVCSAVNDQIISLSLSLISSLPPISHCTISFLVILVLNTALQIPVTSSSLTSRDLVFSVIKQLDEYNIYPYLLFLSKLGTFPFTTVSVEIFC